MGGRAVVKRELIKMERSTKREKHRGKKTAGRGPLEKNRRKVRQTESDRETQKNRLAGQKIPRVDWETTE